MAGRATHTLIVLWEDELRIAARLLTELRQAHEHDQPSEEYAKLLLTTIRACDAALYGVDSGDPMVLSRVPKVKRKDD